MCLLSWRKRITEKIIILIITLTGITRESSCRWDDGGWCKRRCRSEGCRYWYIYGQVGNRCLKRSSWHDFSRWWFFCDIVSWLYIGRVKRICVFEHSVITNFNCACPAIQRGQGSGFLSEGSSWFTACMSEQRLCGCAGSPGLRCSHRR